jgi:methionyl-tRNA formyltransferase
MDDDTSKKGVLTGALFVYMSAEQFMIETMKEKTNIAYFGGEPMGVPVLEELYLTGITPNLIVSSPDKPVGRKQEMTPPPVKVWAQEKDITVYQPESYKDESTREYFESQEWDVFIVVAYNYILPQWLLDIPKHGVINVHPSMLPLLRGASPIRTAIKDDMREAIGVTIMKMDAKMDTGAILDQMPLDISDENWPIPGPELDLELARMGGAMLADTLREYIAGEIEPQEQDDAVATYCGRLSKADSELLINPKKLPTSNQARLAWLKINAFMGIGDTWFMHEEKRIKIKEAEFSMGKLRLHTVIPEGKSAMPFDVWLASLTS